MSIGTRMKNNYEDRSATYLTRRTPVILRIDGKAFHTYTKNFVRPFDDFLSNTFMAAAQKLGKEIQGAKFCYHQSDEVSFLITDFDRLNTEAWFDYNVQKMTSIAASVFGAYFNRVINSFISYKRVTRGPAFFDVRVFNIPKEEVVNYFLWRQQDWWRNSISMLTRHYYSHKECHGKNTAQMHDMLHEVGINWNDLEFKWKNGQCYDFENDISPGIDNFNNFRDYMNKFLEPKEE